MPIYIFFIRFQIRPIWNRPFRKKSGSDPSEKPEPDHSLRKNRIRIQALEKTGSGFKPWEKPDPDQALGKTGSKSWENRIRVQALTGSGSKPREKPGRIHNPGCLFMCQAVQMYVSFLPVYTCQRHVPDSNRQAFGSGIFLAIGFGSGFFFLEDLGSPQPGSDTFFSGPITTVFFFKIKSMYYFCYIFLKSFAKTC